MTTAEIPLHRTQTPGHEGWPRVATPGAPNKYFMVSADCHVNEPPNLWVERIEPQYRNRLPRIEVDANGVKWSVVEGYKPQKLRDLKFEGEDLERSKAGSRDPEERLRDHARDGIDAEIIFPNRGLQMWATPDPLFSQAMCRVYNTWAWEVFGPYYDRLSPLACIASGDIEGAVAEVYRVAKLGFRGLSLPCKPTWGPGRPEDPNYNLPVFGPLWAAIEETGLPMTFHVSTGKDPRGAKGFGGAVINYAIHSLAPTAEPVANLCSSGVLDRFPGLRFATIEAGIGWVPWLLRAMDEAYEKHHMWAFPKLQMMPSEYYRKHGAASFQEDPPGIDLVERYGLEKNFMWANDYPHHEGSWPHSAAAIERTMGHLNDDTRARILGLNAAEFFGFTVSNPG
ncbi:MAG TPA: amidohydrolase family protein [Dehalococcoidia bacterium]|nr:amidohydrolase family protein [Dehalococcoidia bacterium]